MTAPTFLYRGELIQGKSGKRLTVTQIVEAVGVARSTLLTRIREARKKTGSVVITDDMIKPPRPVLNIELTERQKLLRAKWIYRN